MKPEDFLRIAREKISNDPSTRLTPLAKSAIAAPDCVFDVHCHIFDKKCLSIGYIALRFVREKIAGLIGLSALQVDGMGDSPIKLLIKDDDSLYEEIKKKKNKKDTKKEWKAFEAEIEALTSIESTALQFLGFDTDGLKRAWQVLKKGSMGEVFELYFTDYALRNLDEFKNRPFVTGILLMDLETGWDMKPEKKYQQQIAEVKLLSKTRPILPFLAVDPRRAELSGSDNLYELFLNAFTDTETPFFGVKCYPALGYFPSDVRLEPIFQICEEKNIPITTHCGGEIVSTFETTIQIKSSTGLSQFRVPGNTQRERARFLNNPTAWHPVIDKHPKLKVNLAHFAGDTNWSDFGNTGSNERIEEIIAMVSDNNRNVYADFSFNVVETDLFQKLNETLTNNSGVANRTLFGTDYWVVLPEGDLMTKQAEFLDVLRTHKAKLISQNPRNFLMQMTTI